MFLILAMSWSSCSSSSLNRRDALVGVAILVGARRGVLALARGLGEYRDDDLLDLGFFPCDCGRACCRGDGNTRGDMLILPASQAGPSLDLGVMDIDRRVDRGESMSSSSANRYWLSSPPPVSSPCCCPSLSIDSPPPYVTNRLTHMSFATLHTMWSRWRWLKVMHCLSW